MSSFDAVLDDTAQRAEARGLDALAATLRDRRTEILAAADQARADLADEAQEAKRNAFFYPVE